MTTRKNRGALDWVGGKIMHKLLEYVILTRMIFAYQGDEILRLDHSLISLLDADCHNC
jgi:hypothetical protein